MFSTKPERSGAFPTGESARFSEWYTASAEAEMAQAIAPRPTRVNITKRRRIVPPSLVPNAASIRRVSVTGAERRSALVKPAGRRLPNISQGSYVVHDQPLTDPLQLDLLK